jgi:hypothetical protein
MRNSLRIHCNKDAGETASMNQAGRVSVESCAACFFIKPSSDRLRAYHGNEATKPMNRPFLNSISMISVLRWLEAKSDCSKISG